MRRFPYLLCAHLLDLAVRQKLLLCAGTAFALWASADPSPGQTADQQTETSKPTLPTPSRARDGQGYTLRVTTREVVVEVVARDRNNHPINDLTAEDFQIFEGAHKDQAGVRKVSGFRVIDPDAERDSNHTPARLVILPLGGRCEIRSTVHYELAFHPASWIGGIHTIRVVTSRKHVSLSYRTQFYVGVSNIPQAPLDHPVAKLGTDLRNVACYHAEVPPSILLSLDGVETHESHPSRYLLTISPDSLPLAGIEELSSEVQLEYGVCTFSRSGRVLGFWGSSVERHLDGTTLSTVLDKGWTEEIEIPRHGKPALTRFVVREPRSGNSGFLDVEEKQPNAKALPEPTPEGARHRLVMPADVAAEVSEPVGGHLLLGSPVPASNALCGDVYELPRTTTFLPDDFKKLNAVGSIFATSLSVPERILPQGLPGSTSRSDWFGVDYYGEFWVTNPGKYEFVLSADDGADLYIDEHRVIDDDGIHPPRTVNGAITLEAGRHTIHLPYFQGPTYVSLELQVKPPGGTLDVFDLRNYARPH